MIFSDVKQQSDIVSVPVQHFQIYWKDEAFGPEITVIVVVIPKKMADKLEESDRKNSCVPRIAITKPCREKIQAKSLSLSFPSVAIWGVPGPCSGLQVHPSWYQIHR